MSVNKIVVSLFTQFYILVSGLSRLWLTSPGFVPLSLFSLQEPTKFLLVILDSVIKPVRLPLLCHKI